MEEKKSLSEIESIKSRDSDYTLDSYVSESYDSEYLDSVESRILSYENRADHSGLSCENIDPDVSFQPRITKKSIIAKSKKQVDQKSAIIFHESKVQNLRIKVKDQTIQNIKNRVLNNRILRKID